MLKGIFYILALICILFTFNSVFGETEIDYTEIPDYCKVNRVLTEPYQEFLNTSNYYDYFKDDLIGSVVDSNFTKNITYNVYDSNLKEEVEIKFIGSNETLADEFGIYYPSTSRMRIYLANIYDSYAGEWGEEGFVTKSINTFHHEIYHHLEKSFPNRSVISEVYNIEYEYNESLDEYVLANQEYFENITGVKATSLVDDDPDVEHYLRPSVDFSSIFYNYDLSNHDDEVIARVSALCLRYPNNFNFTYELNSTEQYKFCQEFENLTDDYKFQFDSFISDILKTGFYEFNPEYRLEPMVINDEQCSSWFSSVRTQKLTIAYYDTIGYILDNAVSIIISLATLSIIGVLINFARVNNWFRKP